LVLKKKIILNIFKKKKKKKNSRYLESDKINLILHIIIQSFLNFDHEINPEQNSILKTNIELINSAIFYEIKLIKGKFIYILNLIYIYIYI